MVDLSVNVDHVATLRQARQTYEPDPVWAACAAHLGGADGITVHLREDRRHIQLGDLSRLREVTQVRFNLEMAPTQALLAVALATKPDQVTLVPERRQEVTTEGGINICERPAFFADFLCALAELKVPVSVFVDADLRQIEAAARAGADICELHTGPYAAASHRRDISHPQAVAARGKLSAAMTAATILGMKVHAGHALNYYNVSLIAGLADVRMLHVGHAIVSRALFVGFEQAVREMKAIILEAVSTLRASRVG